MENVLENFCFKKNNLKINQNNLLIGSLFELYNRWDDVKCK